MDYPTRFAGAVSAAGYAVNKGANYMAKHLSGYWPVLMMRVDINSQ